jgi:hypothetical protein
VLAGGGALVGTVVLGVLGKPHTPKLSVSEFAKKLRQDIPKYRFRITLPVAAVGAGSLAVAARRRNDDRQGDAGRARFVLTLLVAWSAVTLMGYLAFKVLHIHAPAHRFLAFALALPILAALGIIAAGRWLARWARPVAVLLVAAALAGAAYQSHVILFRFQTWMDPAKVIDATEAGAYIQAARIGGDRPLIFLVGQSDSSYTALMGHMIRLTLPADRIGHVYVFVGSGDDYLARRPLATPSGPNPISVRYLTNLEQTYAENPVALVLRSFNAGAYQQWVDAHPQSEVARNVAVVRGPLPPAPVPRARSPIGGLGAFRIGVFGVAAMALLAAVGLGWAILLLRRWLRPVHLLAVSPAVGIAAVVVAGIVVDRVGIRLVGFGGIFSLLLAAGSAWAILGLRMVRGRPHPPADPVPAPG